MALPCGVKRQEKTTANYARQAWRERPPARLETKSLPLEADLEPRIILNRT